MKDSNFYVILFDTGLYWCGYNTVSSQLRKAKIYTNLKKADEAAIEAINRYSVTNKLDTKNADIAKAYSIMSINVSLGKCIKTVKIR